MMATPAGAGDGETSREDWELYLEKHKAQIRSAIEQHRSNSEEWWSGAPSSIDYNSMSLADAFTEATNQVPGVEFLSPSVYAKRGNGKPPRRVQGGSEHIYDGDHTALICLRPHHIPRRWAIFTIESFWFDPLILITIGMNCFTMAWGSPLDPEGTWKADFISKCEWVYLAIFTLELMLKIVSYGFIVPPGAYLRQAWCQLDFVVVALAW